MGWVPIEYNLYQILWKSVKWLSVWINGTTHRQYGHLWNYLSFLWGREGAYSCNGLFPLSFHGPIENTQQCYKTFILFTFILFFHHKLQSVQGFMSSGVWCCAVGWVVPKVLNHSSGDKVTSRKTQYLQRHCYGNLRFCSYPFFICWEN